jgi:hypothetical protein
MQVMGHFRPGWEPGIALMSSRPTFVHAAGASAFVLEQPRPPGAADVQRGRPGPASEPGPRLLPGATSMGVV